MDNKQAINLKTVV